jgi:hypothetical protein
MWKGSSVGLPSDVGGNVRLRLAFGCSDFDGAPQCSPVRPNVRAKRATTAGRQARAGENVPRTARPGLAACRWRSA